MYYVRWEKVRTFAASKEKKERPHPNPPQRRGGQVRELSMILFRTYKLINSKTYKQNK